jgi:hypothetical protein
MIVFEKLLEPVMPIIERIEAQRPRHGNETFTWLTLVRIMVYCLTKRSKGRNEWVITCADADPAVNIPKVSHSTLSDGLNRFSPRLLRRALAELLDQCELPQNPELALIGSTCAVDGSEFPVFNGMTLPKTRETVKRVKLHLKFNLNQLVVADFLLSLTESDERLAFRKMLTKGVTYILDRGYMAFALLKQATEAQAFIVMRAYNNIVVETVEERVITVPGYIRTHWSELRDRMVRSNHPDAQGIIFRLVEFTIGPSTYRLITNRTDLTTFQVILLYAYRWQIELIFRFFKRTMTGMHIVSTLPWGMENFFTGMFLTAILHLLFKQACLRQEQHLPPDVDELLADTLDTDINVQESTDSARPTATRVVACFMATINQKFALFWKIPKHWLITLGNYLHRQFTSDVVHTLNQRALYGCNRL